MSTDLTLHRRRFFQAATAGCGLSLSAFGEVLQPTPGTVRDKLWLFSNPTNADYDLLLKRSVMSPFEAAVYMGTPNIWMVQQFPRKGQESWYKPFEPPLEQYTIPLTMLKRVAWSLTGASGRTSEAERKEVLAMVKKVPNLVGVYLDDFFRDKGPQWGSLSLDQLRDIRQELKGFGKKVDIYVTFYAHQLKMPIAEYLALMDVVTLWMWKPEELNGLDAHLANLKKLAPHAKVIVGLYTRALNENQKPGWVDMPLPLMKMQAEKSLAWLRGGRIEGIGIYGGTTLDLGFKAVDWTRAWVKEIADTKL